MVLAISFFSGQLARSSALLWLAFGLQLGGATGNLIDRLTQHGFVTDFVNFHVFAVFNVADSAIVVGTVLLAYYALVTDDDAMLGGEDDEEDSSDGTTTKAADGAAGEAVGDASPSPQVPEDGPH